MGLLEPVFHPGEACMTLDPAVTLRLGANNEPRVRSLKA
jgi:hypothetical protein